MAGYGLRPINKTSGGYQTGGSAEFQIEASYDPPIFYGDVVEIAAGFLIRQNGATGESPTATNFTLGVFVGCRYVDSAGIQQYSNYYPGATTETQAFGMVITDPDQLYAVDADGATTVWADTMRGENVALSGFASSSGSTTTGLSGIRIDLDDTATTTLAMRIMDKVDDPDNKSATGTVALPLNVIVRFNFGVLAAHHATAWT